MQRLRRRPYHFLVLAISFSAIVSLLPWRTSPFSWISSGWNPSSKDDLKYAYATFLGPPTIYQSESEADTDSDPYFTSVRLLTYQLLHSPTTRTGARTPIPFLVLTLPSVPPSHLSTLAAAGATIIPIQPLDLPETFNQRLITHSRFRDVLSKLRLWQLTAYTKIVFLDADTILLSPLDSLFTDPDLSTPLATLPGNSSAAPTGAPPPSTYLLAASADTWGPQSEWLKPGHPEYLCACFMLLSPSEEMFQYYTSILSGPDAPSNAAYPEQDLLIYAHRRDGRMPWRRIPVQWSANDGRLVGELAGGVRSLHVKAWERAQGGNAADEGTREMWRGLVREMEEYYRAEGIA